MTITTMENRAPRVLIAEDEAEIRRLVVHVLRRAGFEPFEATDGQHAIEQLDAAPFDALVLDLMMPHVDGFGVVNHLIHTRPEMVEKTIILTAFPKTADRERLHHVCSILSKPFEPQELVQLVQDRVRR